MPFAKPTTNIITRLFHSLHSLSCRQSGVFLFALIMLLFHMLPLFSTVSAVHDSLSIQPNGFLSAVLRLDQLLFYFSRSFVHQNSYIVSLNYIINSLLALHLLVLTFCTLHTQAQQNKSDSLVSRTFIKNYFGIGSYLTNYTAIISSSFLLKCLMESINNNAWLLGVSSLLTLSYLYTVLYCLEELQNESNYNKAGLLSKISFSNGGIFFLVKLSMKTIICTVDLSNSKALLYALIGLLTLDIFQLSNSIRSKKYLNQSMDILWIVCTQFTASFQLIFVMSLIFKSELLIKNMVFASLTLTFLASFAIINFRRCRIQRLVLHEQVQTEHEAVMYMFGWMQLALDEKTVDWNLLFALISRHQLLCTEPACFCLEGEGVKQINRAKDYKFILKFIQNHLLRMTIKFPYSFAIELIYLNFRINYMGSFCEISHHLSAFRAKSGNLVRSFRQKYMEFQIEQNVGSITAEINKQSSATNIYKVFQEDSVKDALSWAIGSINQNNMKKYRELSQEFYNVSHIQDICDAITAKIRIVEKAWATFSREQSYNLKILELYLIYFQGILSNRKDAAMVRSMVAKKIQALSSLKGVTHKNIEKYLYSRRACVLQSNLSHEQIGVITNITDTCQQIFKMSKKKMIGSNIHSIMADFLAKPHEKMLRQWINRQTITGTLIDITDIYFVDQNSNCFTGKIHMKIKSLGINIFFYGIIIRDIIDDIAILNKDFEIQGVGQSIQLSGMIKAKYIKKSFSQLSNLPIESLLANCSQITKNFTIKEQSSQKMFRSIEKKLKNESESSESDSEEELKYECEALIQKLNMNKTEYYSIKFLEIKKTVKSSLSNLFPKSSRISAQKTPRRLKKSTRRLSGQTEADVEAEVVESSLEQPTNVYDPTEYQIRFDNNSSSVNSFIIQSNTTMDTFRERMKKLVINIKDNKDERHKKVTAVILIFAVFVCFSSVGQILLYKLGLESFNSILFADAAVSDNNQLFEFVYNRLLMTKVYCSSNETAKIQRCNYLLGHSTSDIINMLYGLIVDDLNVYITNTTSLSGLQFYASYESNVSLKVGDNVMQVSVRQFMEYFYYSLHTIHQKTIANKSNTGFEDIFNVLFDNWETMKYINHNAIVFYTEIGNQQLQTLSSYIYIISIVTALLIMVPLIFIKSFSNYFFNKKAEISKIYRMIKRDLCQNMLQKCQQVDLCLLGSTKEDKDTSIKPIISIQQTKRQQSIKNRFFFDITLVIYYLAISSLCLVSLLTMVNLFPPAQNMVLYINSLMDSENYAIQNYIDLKNYYIGDHIMVNNGTDLFNRLSQAEPNFNFFAKKSIDIFSKYDPSFQSDFNQILVNSVCEEVLDLVKSWQYDDCKLKMHFDLLEKGLVASMTVFHRSTFEAFLKLRMNSVIDKIAYFEQNIFSDIDDYLFLMFRLYQATQARMVQGLNTSISNVFYDLSLMASFEIILTICGIIWWFWSAEDTKDKLSNLYGEAIQLPLPLLRENKKIFSILRDNLQLSL